MTHDDINVGKMERVRGRPQRRWIDPVNEITRTRESPDDAREAAINNAQWNLSLMTCEDETVIGYMINA